MTVALAVIHSDPQANAALTQLRPRSKGSRTGNGIGWAVKQMWLGLAVCRLGWNGKNMYIKIQVPDAGSANTLPYVWMRTAQGDRVPWICSQTDLLALDWEEAT